MVLRRLESLIGEYTMMQKQNLYFIAILPPKADGEKIIQIQKELSERYDTRAALKVEPHITLKAPFLFPAVEHTVVTDWFKQMKLAVSTFELELRDFGAFPNPNRPVIYIKPQANPNLMDLQKQIIQDFRDTFPTTPIMSLELNFKAHLTIAFRDLKPAIFKEAWEEFRNRKYGTSFTVSEIWLMQHNGVKWNGIDSYTLHN